MNGQVLLELSDADLEVGLGVTQPMHRKKLRLAIEERRRPDLVRNPTIGQLTHAWVAAEWLPDLGLSQVQILLICGVIKIDKEGVMTCQ